jgi:hypothetical protein
VAAIQKHKYEILQTEFLAYARQSALDVRSGKLKPQSATEIMAQLDEPPDKILRSHFGK